MMAKRFSLVVVACLAGAVIVTGCSQGNAESGSGRAAVAKPGEPATKQAEVAKRESPLAPYQDPRLNTDDDRDEETKRKVEDVIAECMKREGFEYFPNTSSKHDHEAQEQDLSDPSWVSQYGYGVVNNPRDDAPKTPNREYADSLSESVREAYELALRGPTGGGGCQREATSKVDPESIEALKPGTADRKPFEPLLNAMGALNEKIDTDPERVKVNAEWSDCMADSGHKFSEPGDPAASILQRYSDIFSSLDGNLSDPEWNAAYEKAKEEHKSELDALADEEVELATADLDCRTFVKYDERVEQISYDIELKFVNDNKKELEDLKAVYEQGGFAGISGGK